MTKTNINILDVEDKQDKQGKPYIRIKTDKGWMSCFKQPAQDKLKEYKHKIASVDIKEVGNFKNIEKVYGLGDPQDQDQAEVAVEKPYEANKSVSTERSEQVDRAKALELAANTTEKGITYEDLKKVADEYFNYITKGE